MTTTFVRGLLATMVAASLGCALAGCAASDAQTSADAQAPAEETAAPAGDALTAGASTDEAASTLPDGVIEPAPYDDLSQGVAAVVNGQEIGERSITESIAAYRDTAGLLDDEEWAKWMAENGYTPEKVRADFVDQAIDEVLREQAVAEYDVEVSQEAIDVQVKAMQEMFDSYEDYQNALNASNMTEEQYIQLVVMPTLVDNSLTEAVANETAAAKQGLNESGAALPEPTDATATQDEAAAEASSDSDSGTSTEADTETEANETGAVNLEDEETWLDLYRERAQIEIKDMPADLPYVVDISEYADEIAAAEEAKTTLKARDGLGSDNYGGGTGQAPEDAEDVEGTQGAEDVVDPLALVPELAAATEAAEAEAEAQAQPQTRAEVQAAKNATGNASEEGSAQDAA